MFAYEHTGVTPDIMALAKALGGGFPIGACLATAEASKGMTAGTHGSTFGGNPLAMAVADAVLDVITAKGFLDRVRKNSLALKQRLAELKDRHASVIAEVRGEGLLIGLRMVPPSSEMVDELRNEKMITVAAGDNVVRLLPPLIVGKMRSRKRSRASIGPGPVKAHGVRPSRRRMSRSGNGVRHFLDLIDIPKPVLAGLIDNSRAMKAERARAGRSAGRSPARRWQ